MKWIRRQRAGTFPPNRSGGKMAACFLLAFLPGHALSSSTDWCPAITDPPHIHLKPLTVPVSVDHTQPLAVIREKYRQRLPNQGAGAVGLTDYSLAYQMETRFELTTRNRQETCIRLSDIRLDLGFKRMEILIAREFTEGTCQYKAVWDHEQEHVAINHRIMDKSLPRAKEMISRMARNMPAVRTRQEMSVRDQYSRKLEEAMGDMFREIEEEMKQAHALIDTPASYQAVQSRCAKW